MGRCNFTFREFLPSAPRALALRRKDMIDVTERLLLEKLLSGLALVSDTERARMAVSSIREALYISDDEFYRAFVETLDLMARPYEQD